MHDGSNVRSVLHVEPVLNLGAGTGHDEPVHPLQIRFDFESVFTVFLYLNVRRTEVESEIGTQDVGVGPLDQRPTQPVAVVDRQRSHPRPDLVHGSDQMDQIKGHNEQNTEVQSQL